MAPHETDAEQAFCDAERQLSAAYERAVEAIESIPDAQKSFESATELANDLRQLADDAAKVRARGAVRIRDSERLSLAGLAERLSVSRARADQMVRAATVKNDPPKET
jgi:hypothetical protein